MLIPQFILITILTLQGWSPQGAAIITDKYPGYWNSNLHSFLANWYPGWKVEFGLPTPSGLTTDHEYQHAWHYYKLDGTSGGSTVVENRIRRDFTEANWHPCVKKTIEEQPNDVIHWPHFVLTCVDRVKSKIPSMLVETYYDWMQLTYSKRVHIPVFVGVQDGR